VSAYRWANACVGWEVWASVVTEAKVVAVSGCSGIVLVVEEEEEDVLA
jgi:hypothetical protein